MGVKLNQNEIDSFLENGHTCILTTLRRDGFPVSLPNWFVLLDGGIYLNTPSGTKKTARIKNDPRASLLVETGLAWAELKAVMLYGRVSFVEDEEICTKVNELLDSKYSAFRTASAKQPKTTQKIYAAMTTLRFEPEGEPISWDNSKIKLA